MFLRFPLSLYLVVSLCVSLSFVSLSFCLLVSLLLCVCAWCVCACLRVGCGGALGSHTFIVSTWCGVSLRARSSASRAAGQGRAAAVHLSVGALVPENSQGAVFMQIASPPSPLPHPDGGARNARGGILRVSATTKARAFADFLDTRLEGEWAQRSRNLGPHFCPTVGRTRPVFFEPIPDAGGPLGTTARLVGPLLATSRPRRAGMCC